MCAGIYMEAFIHCVLLLLLLLLERESESSSESLPFNRDLNVCENEQGWSERARGGRGSRHYAMMSSSRWSSDTK